MVVTWREAVERAVKEFRPLLKALEAYDKGASEEEIKRILGVKD